MRAGEQTAKLSVDLGAQPSHRGVDRQAAVNQAVKQGQRCPPQAALCGRGLQGFDFGDGVAHCLCAAVRVAAQELEQAAFELWPDAAQGGLACSPLVLCCCACGRVTPWRAARQVGVEEVGRARQRKSACEGDLLVQGGQAQRLVGRAVRDFLEVVADAGDRARDQRQAVTIDREFAARHQAEQHFGRVGKLGEAIEADDGQGTTHLVEVCLRELHAGGRVRGVRSLGQRGGGALQGGVDLAFNPCERAEIRLLGLCHGVLPGVTAFRP